MKNTTNLLLALEEAKQMQGQCAPNPAVGAVIVKNGKMLATGFHRGPFTAHAERDALNQLAPEISQDATLYVTLEPCCHHGRTPPCTDLIIERKIARVVYGFADPNPLVTHQGATQLKKAGIEVEYHPLPEINQFYESYAYWWQHKKPWISLKLALSSDDKVAGKHGEPIAITGKKTNEYTHRRRWQSDALLTTARTIIADDPQLNARIKEGTLKKSLYVLDHNLQLPLRAQIFLTAKSITVFHKPTCEHEKKIVLEKAGVTCIELSCNNNQLNLSQAIAYIGEQGCHNLWVEAGPTLFNAFVDQQLANEVILYRASRLVGPEGIEAQLTALLEKQYSIIETINSEEDVIIRYFRKQ